MAQSGVKLDPKKTALILIEYQNDFTSEGGALHSAVKGVMNSTSMISNTAALVEEARALGVTVMWAPISFAEGYREIMSHPYGVLSTVVGGNAFRAGTWGAEISQALPRANHDIVIEGKRGLDTFASTNLDFILRSRGIETIIVSGFLTNCCVESTVRTGYEKGFRVVSVKDCTACTSEEEQRFAFEKNLPMFSHVMTSGEVLESLHSK